MILLIQKEYISQEAEYADRRQLADNQHKYLVFEQRENFQHLYIWMMRMKSENSSRGFERCFWSCVPAQER